MSSTGILYNANGSLVHKPDYAIPVQTVSVNNFTYDIPINPKAFTLFGDAYRRGDFTNLNKESYEWHELWDEQYRYCKYGIDLGGKFMSGDLYGYINFGTIRIIEEDSKGNEVTKKKKSGPPELRDIEWILDQEITRAKRNKKNLLYITGRRGGKSYYGSWRQASQSLFHGQNTVIAVGHDDKGQIIYNMAKDHLIGLVNTEFFLPYNDTKGNNLGISYGYEYKEEDGGGFNSGFVWHNFGGAIHVRNFKNNPTAANGLDAVEVCFEEIGMFNNFKLAYSNSEFLWKDGSEVYGFALAQGTGGDMESGSLDAAEVFEKPEAYNFNYFHDGQSEKKICMFLPGYYADNNVRNKSGIVDPVEGVKRIEAERERRKEDQVLYYQYLQNMPLKWKEAFLRNSGGKFQAALIAAQIERIESDPLLANLAVYGYMTFENGLPVFKPDGKLRPVDYPVISTTDKTGCVTVYEPPTMSNGRVVARLYGGGYDPVQQDKISVTSKSIHSVIIWKRVYNPAGEITDTEVANYSGRNEGDHDEEQIMLLLLYYGAECLYENMNNSFKKFLENKQRIYLLAPSPTSVISNAIETSVVDREYGIHMTTGIRKYGENQIYKWIGTEYTEGHYNIEKIYDLWLLKELLMYDGETNADRVDSLMLALMKNQADGDADIGIETERDLFHTDHAYTTQQTSYSLY